MCLSSIHGHKTAFAQMDYYVAAHTGSHIEQALLSDGAEHIHPL